MNSFTASPTRYTTGKLAYLNRRERRAIKAAQRRAKRNFNKAINRGTSRRK